MSEMVERCAKAMWEADYCDGWSWPEVVKFAEAPYLSGEQPRRPSQEWAIGNLENYRRKVRAVLTVVRGDMQDAAEAGTDVVDAWHYLRDDLDSAIGPPSPSDAPG